MKKIRITITAQAHAAIRASATRPFVETGRRLADGSWSIEIDEVTEQRLAYWRLEGESYSDVIIRLVAGRSH